MTYEKFEFKVLGMLLEGNDPRLERLLAQTWDSEVLSRDETEMGFNVKFLAPAPLAINESEGRIFGVEVKLSENEIINLELVIKGGLIDRLRGTFTSEMRYADIVKRYNDLTFSYKNERSSEINFHSDNRVEDEVTFVKNIATISKEIDANISRGLELEKEEAKESAAAELIEEPFTLVLDTKEAETPEEVPVVTEEVEAPEEAPVVTEEDGTPEEESVVTEEAETTEEAPVVAEEAETTEEAPVVAEEAETTEEAPVVAEEAETTEEVPVVAEEAETTEEAPVVTEEAETPEEAPGVTEEDNLMMPPSFSIPKVPEAIKKNWILEEVPLLSESSQEGKTSPISSPVVTSDDLEKDPGFSDLLDGKAPQGPVSFGENLEAKDEQTLTANALEEEQKSEFKNLTPKELSNPDLEIENPIEIDPEELESEALSAVDLDEVNRSIALMEKKNKELRIVTILIVLVTLVTIGFILSMLFSS